MRFGDLIAKDKYDREITVGSLVDHLSWYSGSWNLYRSIAIGLTSSGNIRTMVAWKGDVSFTWSPKGLLMAAPESCLVDIDNYVSSDHINDYAKGDSTHREFCFVDILSRQTDNKLQQLNLEIN